MCTAWILRLVSSQHTERGLLSIPSYLCHQSVETLPDGRRGPFIVPNAGMWQHLQSQHKVLEFRQSLGSKYYFKHGQSTWNQISLLSSCFWKTHSGCLLNLKPLKDQLSSLSLPRTWTPLSFGIFNCTASLSAFGLVTLLWLKNHLIYELKHIGCDLEQTDLWIQLRKCWLSQQQAVSRRPSNQPRVTLNSTDVHKAEWTVWTHQCCHTNVWSECMMHGLSVGDAADFNPASAGY